MAEALSMMRREQAREQLRSLATGIREPSEEEAVARLLERVAKREPELQAVLLEIGAAAIVTAVEAERRDDALAATGMGSLRRFA